METEFLHVEYLHVVGFEVFWFHFEELFDLLIAWEILVLV